MLKLETNAVKITGSPEGDRWTQVHDFKPEDEEKFKKRGRLFAVISTKIDGEEKTSTAIEPLTAGRELLTRLHEEYFGKEDLSPFNALKKALERLVEEFSSTYSLIEIAAASYVEDVVYSACVGGAQAALYRGNMLATILNSTAEKTVAASGYPKENDVFLLGTSSFFAEFPAGGLKKELEEGAPSLVLEKLSPAIQTSKNSPQMGVVMVSFKKENMLMGKIESGEEKREEGEKDEKPAPRRKISFPSLKRGGAFLSKIIPQRKMVIKRREVDVEESQKKKTTLTVGILLLSLLVVSIFFGARKKKEENLKSQYEPRLLAAIHEVAEAKEVYSLSPERSIELFASSEKTAKELVNEGVMDERLESLLADLAVAKAEILKEFSEEPSIFVDLTPLSDNFRADVLIGNNERMAILDKESSLLAEIVVDTKKTSIVAGPSQLSGALYPALYTDRFYVLMSGGIYEVGDKKEKRIDDEWSGEVFIYSYAGNIYVLEKGASKIWRYAATSSGFGNASNWLASSVSPDFTKVIDWSIDGTIWLLTSTGKIERYALGNPQPLGKLQASPELTLPTAIYTNEELESFYVLDKSEKRVVVFDKEGVYKAQYKSEKLGEAKDLYVSEKEGVIIFLAEDILYSLEIKHD